MSEARSTPIKAFTREADKYTVLAEAAIAAGDKALAERFRAYASTLYEDEKDQYIREWKGRAQENVAELLHEGEPGSVCSLYVGFIGGEASEPTLQALEEMFGAPDLRGLIPNVPGTVGVEFYAHTPEAMDIYQFNTGHGILLSLGVERQPDSDGAQMFELDAIKLS